MADYKKGTLWNRKLTAKMLQFERETSKNAIYRGKITGQFEYWLFHKKRKESISIKKLGKSLKKNKIMEKDLIIMAIKQLDSAEKKRKLNSAQKRRRQELKIELRKVDKELKKLVVKKPEPLNIKDKRPLKEFHYFVLKSLKETPNVTQKNIYIEEKLVKKFPKSYLDDLVKWKYATKSSKNKYSITRQGNWRLKELARVVAENKQKAKLKKHNEIIRKLAKAKKQLSMLKKKKEDIEERNLKLMRSLSKEAKDEWQKYQYDYKTWDMVEKNGKWEYISFPWSNPKEAEIIISIRENDGFRELEYRKAYNKYYGTKRNIELYEEQIKKFKGTYKKKKEFRTRIQIEIELGGVLKSLKNHPNNRELKKLEKKLRKELIEAIEITAKRKRSNWWD